MSLIYKKNSHSLLRFVILRGQNINDLWAFMQLDNANYDLSNWL